MLEASIVIPTYQRSAKLARCLGALARQTINADRYEVLVGLDGPDDASAAAAVEAWRRGGGRDGTLHVIACPREGYNATRNRVLALARGRVLISMNDDVVAEGALVETHVAEQSRAASRLGRGAIISGYAPFARWDDQAGGASVFDRLCAETSMIFFYDRMIGPDAVADADEPWKDWGFRHCYGLNFSAPLEAIRAVGGFVSFPLAYGYDDIEIAWRLRQDFGMPVLFRPLARGVHDHRYGPGEVLEREFKLGQSAWRFAGVNPGFAADVFGRDIRSRAELDYSREFIAREAGSAGAIDRTFRGLADVPAHAIGGDCGQSGRTVLQALSQQHVLLKRWTWRRGLLDAANADGSGSREGIEARSSAIRIG